tara:strand:+ start:1568 stop:2179 length:612 start_codon:yes stop_codon:yes gene_type:complete
MKLTIKSILIFVGLLLINSEVLAEINPNQFIDVRAQAMVKVIRSNQSLYLSDPDLFKAKINDIFEPMVDFRRVGASVMGKKFYSAATSQQRKLFIETFRRSLLDTYSSTLAQWGDQKIETIFPDSLEFDKTEDVHQNLITSNNRYPITYKVRNDGEGNWLIINIIVNGVNLGLTFRNQFQALAAENNNNIDSIIKNWTSDANL